MLDSNAADTAEPVSDDRSSASAELVSAPEIRPARKNPAAMTPAPSLAKTNSGNAKPQTLAARTAVHPSLAVQGTKLVAEPSLAAAPATLQPVAPAADPSANLTKLDSSAPTYLEVGSFKESKWADDAVERLTQMGFHAICVHKTMLWKLQSYHVEVGPYSTSSEMQGAQDRLAAQGFKPHPVK
jgi:cell division protein FtsN